MLSSYHLLSLPSSCFSRDIFSHRNSASNPCFFPMLSHHCLLDIIILQISQNLDANLVPFMGRLYLLICKFISETYQHVSMTFGTEWSMLKVERVIKFWSILVQYNL